MDSEIRQIIEQTQRHRVPLDYIGKHNGKPCFVIRRRLTYRQLSKKYPQGVVPRWKSQIIKTLHRGYHCDSPWFSDVLDKCCGFLLRG